MARVRHPLGNIGLQKKGVYIISSFDDIGRKEGPNRAKPLHSQSHGTVSQRIF
jgi:hypothetical protein